MIGISVNMCALDRSFGIKDMVKGAVRAGPPSDGLHVFSGRSTLCTSQPGSELLVEHIDRYWCPTVVRGDILKAIEQDT